MLSLHDYALFSIATMAAGGVLPVIGPLAVALGPRLIRLHASNDRASFVHLYNQTTQLTALVAFPAALTLAVFPAETLWGWTGNPTVAQDAAPVLALYALGNGLLAIGGLPLQLQIAAGQLRLHVIGTTLFVLLFLPAMWWATRRAGMTGAGCAWLAINLLFVCFWVAIAHRKFLPGSHLSWLGRQVLAVLIPTVIVAGVLRVALPWPEERWLVVAELFGVGGVLFAVSAVSSATLRVHLAVAARHLVFGFRQ
jgi:O-antigen/teichoic acid export membrane protein